MKKFALLQGAAALPTPLIRCIGTGCAVPCPIDVTYIWICFSEACLMIELLTGHWLLYFDPVSGMLMAVCLQ
jgi:hypothetical protein